MKRKKRLKKGIDSIEQKIRLHEEKLERARQEKDEILQQYYEKEIEALRKVKERKEKQRNK